MSQKAPSLTHSGIFQLWRLVCVSYISNLHTLLFLYLYTGQPCLHLYHRDVMPLVVKRWTHRSQHQLFPWSIHGVGLPDLVCISVLSVYLLEDWPLVAPLVIAVCEQILVRLRDNCSLSIEVLHIRVDDYRGWASRDSGVACDRRYARFTIGLKLFPFSDERNLFGFILQLLHLDSPTNFRIR